MSAVRKWEHPALTAALKAVKGRRGKPTEADRPPPSLFPMTPAARAAKAMTEAARAAKAMRERKGRIEP